MGVENDIQRLFTKVEEIHRDVAVIAEKIANGDRVHKWLWSAMGLVAIIAVSCFVMVVEALC